MMPNLIPPKIPDGEKVDFDVSDRLGFKTWDSPFTHCLLYYNILYTIT